VEEVRWYLEQERRRQGLYTDRDMLLVFFLLLVFAKDDRETSSSDNQSPGTGRL
jgi:hypothetical protein